VKRELTEESILFVSVIKWFVLASITGAMVGAATALFIHALNWSTAAMRGAPYILLLLPFALFLSSLLTKYLAPEAEGHGTEKVIEAVHRYGAVIKARVVPVKVAATIVTLAVGGSAGKEGPCAQIGGSLASIFAGLLRFTGKDRKKLVICGISAGFAAVFGTPIAGAIFGIEVLVVGSIMYDVLLPSFIAGVIGYEVSSALGISYFYHVMNFVPNFSQILFIKVVLGGIFFGLCSRLLIECLHYFKGLAGMINIWEPAKGLIGGAAIAVLALIFSRDYLGLGLNTIETTLVGKSAVWYAFLVKILFTSITLTFGGSGGIVTPIFFIGATAGSFFGNVLGVDPTTFAAIGMAGLLAGSANTPIAASILAVELFGPKVAPYAAVACVVSFLMTGHKSVYPSQVLAIRKSSSIKVELGGEIEASLAEFSLRENSLIYLVLSTFRKIISRARQNRKK